MQRGPLRVGTDPDEALQRNTALTERHRLLLAREFAAAGATVLRPGGGSWFALTHDVHHYFGVTARVAHHLGWP